MRRAKVDRRAAIMLLAIVSTLLFTLRAHAQGNYEIQVYAAPTIEPKSMMVELHSNFTAVGEKRFLGGVYPTNHQQHETLEITRGINKWSEVGFYVFTSLQDGHGWQWVGDHIRPRVTVPDSWHWPLGVSLSTEIGYQRAAYSPDTWTWEIRPILDKSIGRWYLATNPALERTWHGPGIRQGLDFAPAAKIGYDFTKAVSGGIEYYADYGRLGDFSRLHDQQQQMFLVTDLNVSPKWEINLGVGVGATAATDHWIIKGILGRHFSWTRPSAID